MSKHDNQPLLFSKEPANSDVDPTQQAINLLGLSTVGGIGPSSLRALCQHYPDLSEVWAADAMELLSVLHSAHKRASEKLVDSIRSLHDRLLKQGQLTLDRLQERGIHLLVDCHPQFPEQVREVPNRPYWLFVEGDPTLLSRKSLVAVVGTRRASQSGVSLTKKLTKELVRWGFVVVSGLAEGIDTAAHSTVLTFGGYTIAVLGNGLNIDFPSSNRDIRRRIVATGGAVVTDHFPDTMYSAANFVKRNRIIAGLSGAVIPVESKAKSGTAHTIRFAEECRRMLISVTASRHQISLDNEIPSLLRDKGHSCVDLDSPQELERLHGLLSEFKVDAIPKEVDEEAQREACYSEVLDVFKKTLDSFPLDKDGLDWLIRKIQRVVRERKDAD